MTVGVAAGIAFALAAVGCSQTADPTTEESNIDRSLTDFMESASEPYRGDTVKVLAISSAQATAMAEMAKDFEKITGINVDITTVAENDLVTKAQVTLSSNSPGFDVLQTLSFFVPSYAENEWLYSVDELEKNADITYTEVDEAAYAPAATAQLTYADELWARPMFVATQLFYYRTDIFEEADVDVPETIEELLAAAESIDSSETPAIAMRAGVGPTQNLFPWSAWLYNMGGGYFEAYDSETGEYSGPTLDQGESVEAAKVYAETLQDYGPDGALTWAVADVTRAFLSGQVAMIQEGSPFGGTLNDPEESGVAGKVGAFAMPAGEAGSYYPSAAQGWGVNRYSEHPEAAWLFTQWASDPSVLLESSLRTPFSAPPLVSVFDNEEFRAKYDFPGFLDSLETSLKGESSPIGGPYIPALQDWQAVGQQVSVDFNKVITKQISAEDGMKSANEILKSALK